MSTNATTNAEKATSQAMTPVIVSASRSTDIPAFYAPWFMERLRKGYCVWCNPFNRRPSTVSFEKTRAIVFWSKNAAPLVPFLEELDAMGLGYYLQYTINNYEREGFEPNLPPLASRIETFWEIAHRIGPERIIWRFDPIILGRSISPRDILHRIWAIGNLLKNATRKLVFSFVDVAAYRKVQNNMAKTSYFSKDDVLSAEARSDQVEEICEGLVKIRERWIDAGWNIVMATCAEQVDLDKYQIEHNRCIDDVLLKKLYPHDAPLMEFLCPRGRRQGSLLESAGNGLSAGADHEPRLKDKGQRKECGCIQSKDIGMYNTCAHFCTYCYANTSKEAVKRNRAQHEPMADSILPFGK